MPIKNQTAILRWTELIAIYIGLPLLYYFDKIPFHKSIPLLSVFGIMLIIMLRSRHTNRSIFGFNKFGGWKALLVRFGAIAVLMTLYVWLVKPDWLFIIPRERFRLWLLIMVFYPIWSAYPQELIYRAWFFQRYEGLVKNQGLFLVLNALLFSFSHIIFRNALALLLTFAGSFMFALTYRKSNSLMVVFIEHMLYGNYIFTVGLGEYFYLPMTGG